ncbi:hypothetical protein DFJ74DRAFT_422236 [Hyaloraphidium curvatum]|nr:hypothetical protein DFJ74DRAFT_422236 [Hyaloraphidium curvatum]
MAMCPGSFEQPPHRQPSSRDVLSPKSGCHHPTNTTPSSLSSRSVLQTTSSGIMPSHPSCPGCLSSPAALAASHAPLGVHTSGSSVTCCRVTTAISQSPNPRSDTSVGANSATLVVPDAFFPAATHPAPGSSPTGTFPLSSPNSAAAIASLSTPSGASTPARSGVPSGTLTPLGDPSSTAKMLFESCHGSGILAAASRGCAPGTLRMPTKTTRLEGSRVEREVEFREVRGDAGVRLPGRFRRGRHGGPWAGERRAARETRLSVRGNGKTRWEGAEVAQALRSRAELTGKEDGRAVPWPVGLLLRTRKRIHIDQLCSKGQSVARIQSSSAVLPLVSRRNGCQDKESFHSTASALSLGVAERDGPAA